MVHVIQEEEVELSIARLDELGPEPSHEGGRARKNLRTEELTVMAETLQSAHNFLTLLYITAISNYKNVVLTAVCRLSRNA